MEFIDEDAVAAEQTELERLALRRLAPLLARRSPLERAAALDEIGEYLLWLSSMQVKDSRQEGATWAEVGDAFGITRQGAQQRFGRKHETT